MKNSDALVAVESALEAKGLLILRVGNVTPHELRENEHQDIPAGSYRVVDVSVAVPDNGA